ncbi:ABC transporter substrate-binding protein [Aquiluna sp. Uisw_065]|jgi:osmoprotectant transport system substrate-binding protein|uniref:ABC transporter substrate-binding protein n=1 Tax=Aquiluna sp. Uisw_065 TaxID=3230967 RepID=UPI0039EA1363
MTKPIKKSIKSAIALSAVAVLGLAGCAESSSEPLVIGSQAYYSNEIVAEVYAQVLEDAGYSVDRQFALGQRDVYVPALLAGEIDIFPEYTGNLLQYFDPEATATAEEDVYQALQAALPAGLTALALSGASDQDSYNVTSDFAMKNSLTSIGDLAGVTGIRLGGAPELAERPYGPTGLLSSYGVTVEFEATGDTTVESLVAGLIDMANVYSADPRIQQLGLVTLTDPQGLFLSSNLVPIASDAVNQEARDLISAVSSAMTAADLVALNVRSVDEQLSSAVIARDWLLSKGLID